MLVPRCPYFNCNKIMYYIIIITVTAIKIYYQGDHFFVCLCNYYGIIFKYYLHILIRRDSRRSPVLVSYCPHTLPCSGHRIWICTYPGGRGGTNIKEKPNQCRWFMMLIHLQATATCYMYVWSGTTYDLIGSAHANCQSDMIVPKWFQSQCRSTECSCYHTLTVICTLVTD